MEKRLRRNNFKNVEKNGSGIFDEFCSLIQKIFSMNSPPRSGKRVGKISFGDLLK